MTYVMLAAVLVASVLPAVLVGKWIKRGMTE